ncbi:MAG: twin-arginine translocation signal domain-containing protein [Haloarculaceae archaeon]
MDRETGDTTDTRRQFLKATVAAGAIAGGFSVGAAAQGPGPAGNATGGNQTGANATAGGQPTGGTPTIRLGGEVPGWVGFAPETVSGTGKNPTLQLQQGAVYTLLWKNLDGQPHDFTLLDEQGTQLALIEPLQVPQGNVDVNETNASDLSPANATGNATGGNASMAGGNATGGGQLGGNLVEKTEILSEQGAVQALRFKVTEKVAKYQCTVHPTTMTGDVEVTDSGLGGADGASQSGGGNGASGGNSSGGNHSGGT